MSICIRWAERPNGIVGEAYNSAMDIVGAWLDRPEHASIIPLITGWPHAALCEKIAYALLEAQGYDELLLEEAVDGPASHADAVALDDELRRSLPTKVGL